jgi:hypothetical protein
MSAGVQGLAVAIHVSAKYAALRKSCLAMTDTSPTLLTRGAGVPQYFQFLFFNVRQPDAEPGFYRTVQTLCTYALHIYS